MSVRCIDAVFTGSISDGAARLVLLALADCAADTGEVTAYARSHSTLMAKANVSRGTVRRAIEQLVALGEVEVLTQGIGRTKSDYLIRLDVLRRETVQDEPSQDEPSEGPGETVRRVTVNPQTVDDGPSITPSLPVDVPSSSEPSTFDEFWSAYPRKVGKPSAVKAWDRAVHRATPEAIINGARRYAADPNRVDGFTKHPGPWLNDDRWLDAPLPARNQGPASRPDRNRATLQGALDRAAGSTDRRAIG